MYKIASGSTHGLSDTADFIALLDGVRDDPSEQVRGFFSSGREVIVTRAPGRLDLMGGIADYSGSLVLELPIERATHVALQRQASLDIEAVSLSLNPFEVFRSFKISLALLLDRDQPIEYALARTRFKSELYESHWPAYVAGAFLVLMRERGIEFAEGTRLLISSRVPEGKGVSSSAALEVAVMRAVAAAYDIDISPQETAFLCQKVENLVAGAPCGVMDQMTAACGEEGRLLVLLCQPGELKGTIKLPEELEVWGVDSGIRHSVGGADYGTVRAAAFMGYRIMAEVAGLACRATGTPGLVEIDDARWHGYLANVTPEEFENSFAHHLPEEMSGEDFLRRFVGITDSVTGVKSVQKYPVLAATRHPIYERARVESFAEILRRWRGVGDAPRLGELMYESHESYSACGLGSEGTDELARLVREAGSARGLHGAKITGGGSGGTVAVIASRGAGDAVRVIAEEYGARTGRRPTIISGSSPGAGSFGHLRLVKEAREQAWQFS